jgi:hypothetical protein
MTIERPQLEVYSRPGCHLCEILLEELMPIIRGRLDIEVFDVDTNTDWESSYGERVPVVVFEGHEICHYRLDKDAIARIVDGKTAS